MLVILPRVHCRKAAFCLPTPVGKQKARAPRKKSEFRKRVVPNSESMVAVGILAVEDDPRRCLGLGCLVLVAEKGIDCCGVFF